jgi:prefoldin subunit 4
MSIAKETEQIVRQADQDQISEFGKLHNRLTEVRAEVVQATADLSLLEASVEELGMIVEGSPMIFIGEAFMEVDEEFATEYVEEQMEATKTKIANMKKEEENIEARQSVLKKTLYERFGDAIQLEQ